MSDSGIVSDCEILSVIDNVDDARDVLRIVNHIHTVDGPNEISRIMPFCPVLELDDRRIREYHSILDLVEDNDGHFFPWVGLVARAVEFSIALPPAKVDLQESLLQELESMGVKDVRTMKEKAENSAWKCLISQLGRHLPTTAEIARGVESFKTIPSAYDVFKGPVRGDEGHGLLRNPDTKTMHLPTVVMAMMWVHPGSPLWLASVPVIAEIVQKFLLAFGYRFESRPTAHEFQNSFKRVCEERIAKNLLLRGFSRNPLIKECKKKQDTFQKFDGFRYRKDLEDSKRIPKMVDLPLFFDEFSKAEVERHTMKEQRAFFSMASVSKDLDAESKARLLVRRQRVHHEFLKLGAEHCRRRVSLRPTDDC